MPHCEVLDIIHSVLANQHWTKTITVNAILFQHPTHESFDRGQQTDHTQGFAGCYLWWTSALDQAMSAK